MFECGELTVGFICGAWASRVGASLFSGRLVFTFDTQRLFSLHKLRSVPLRCASHRLWILRKTILVWDAESGQVVYGSITGHARANSVASHRTASKFFKFFELTPHTRTKDALTSKSLFLPLTGQLRSVRSACFFPDGSHFATRSDDGTIRIWTLDTTPRDTTCDLRDDNWVVCEKGKLMMWIPKKLLIHLYYTTNIHAFNRPFYLKLRFGTEIDSSRNIQPYFLDLLCQCYPALFSVYGQF